MCCEQTALCVAFVVIRVASTVCWVLKMPVLRTVGRWGNYSREEMHRTLTSDFLWSPWNLLWYLKVSWSGFM